MKYDMCGGANVIGTFVAAVKAKLPLNLVVVVPAVENAIDGNAYRPSDVITSMSGKTIEVGNTDAEGRLILCDALSYVGDRFSPAAIVDCATLTGSVVIGLGHHAAGVLGTDEALVEELQAAGDVAGAIRGLDRAAKQAERADAWQGMRNPGGGNLAVGMRGQPPLIEAGLDTLYRFAALV